MQYLSESLHIRWCKHTNWRFLALIIKAVCSGCTIFKKNLEVRNRFSYVTRRIEKCNNCIHHHCKTPITKEPPYRHSASASKCLECLWSMMTRSWCFSKKHSRADSGVRAMLHLKLAFSHAQQKPLLWLSSLAKTKSTCRKRTIEDIFKPKSQRSCTKIHFNMCLTSNDKSFSNEM